MGRSRVFQVESGVWGDVRVTACVRWGLEFWRVRGGAARPP